MDFRDRPEHRDLRAAVSAVTRSFGDTYFTEHAERREPTSELWQALGRQGFLGINLPEEYGGGGAGLTELAIVVEQTAAEGCPLLLLLVSSAICGEMIARYGTPRQRQRWLPPLADGSIKMAFAITEPDAGSNSHRLATTARRDGDQWLLTGTKYYISGADEAVLSGPGAILVVARTGTDEATGRARLSLFLVPADAPGLTLQPLPVAAMMPERQFTVYFTDVRLGPDDLLGTEHEGFGQVFHGLNPERITGAALCLGIGRYALARAAQYARVHTV